MARKRRVNEAHLVPCPACGAEVGWRCGSRTVGAWGWFTCDARVRVAKEFVLAEVERLKRERPAA